MHNKAHTQRISRLNNVNEIIAAQEQTKAIICYNWNHTIINKRANAIELMSQWTNKRNKKGRE